ncbi:MAG: permease [bacterium]
MDGDLAHLLELAPWLFLGAAVAGALHVLVPAGFLQRHLRGRAGVAKAIAIGVPLPLCSCGVIPAGLGLKKDGASDAAAIGFLVSTPQTGVDSILVSAAFLGWPFALFKVGAAAVTGLLAGTLVERFGGPPVPLAEPVNAEEAGGGHGLRAAVAHGLEMIRTIWRWLVVGILISAALTTLIPPSALEGIGLTGALAPVLVLLVSLPLYVCATASVPIAAGLVAAGMPVGAALVFLMAGPATNIATMGAILRGFGRRVLAIYLGTLVVGSVGLAWAFDFVLADAAATPTHAMEHGAWWQVGAAALLLGLLAAFAVDDLRRRLRRAPAGPAVLQIQVEGMTCGACARRLEGALNRLEGVEAAEVSKEAGQAIVRGQAGLDAIARAITDAGFRPVLPPR